MAPAQPWTDRQHAPAPSQVLAASSREAGVQPERNPMFIGFGTIVVIVIIVLVIMMLRRR